MKDFIETIANKILKKNLAIAIAGKGAFARFKNVLLEYPSERERWFKFKKKKIMNKIHVWLYDAAIEII